ncbi:MAG: hypothetical protein WBV85_00655 [Solirubrobacteraceae bacterium]
MGRRSRARAKSGAAPLAATTSDYTDAEGNVLVLRGSLTVGARREYADTLAGAGGHPQGHKRAAATKEDSEQRAAELLFERLAVRWTISGVPIERPKELLMRLRASAPAERAWVRGALREHCAEWFPDVRVP